MEIREECPARCSGGVVYMPRGVRTCNICGGKGTVRMDPTKGYPVTSPSVPTHSPMPHEDTDQQESTDG